MQVDLIFFRLAFVLVRKFVFIGLVDTLIMQVSFFDMTCVSWKKRRDEGAAWTGPEGLESTEYMELRAFRGATWSGLERKCTLPMYSAYMVTYTMSFNPVRA